MPFSPRQFIASACFALAGIAGAQLLYSEVISNRIAAAEYASARTEMRARWDSATTQVSAPSPVSGLGLLTIPRIVDTAWEVPLLAGTTDAVLNKGVGLLNGSARPGEPGNTVVLGHRSSHGRPFAGIDELRAGDRVVIETESSWFVYTLVLDKVVRKDETWVMGKNPTPALAGKDHLISIISCTPTGSTSHRWVWWGVLDASFPRAAAVNPYAAIRLDDPTYEG